MADENEDIAPEEQERDATDYKSEYEALKSELESQNTELKRLVTENKKYRERAQKAEFQRLKAKYPTLDEEDLAGLNADQVEKLLSKVTETPTPEGEQHANNEVRQQAQDFVATAGGQAPPAEEPLKFEDLRAELKAGKRTWSEVRQLVAQGKVDGVEAP